MGRKAKKPSGGYSGDNKPSDAKADDRVELITEEGDASRSFKLCLIQIFNRFDIDKDKHLSESELKTFSREANPDGREFTSDELEEMKECFDWNEKGPGGVAGLTLRGWQQMYIVQTTAEPEETWRDLMQLGYDGQLKLVSPQPEVTVIKTSELVDADEEEDSNDDDASKAKQKTGKLPRSLGLRAAINRFIELGEGDDVRAFVEAFVATDIDEEDKAAFAADLEADGRERLQEVLGELRCCATGEGVFKIEEKKEKEGAEKSPVTIHFHAPGFRGLENVDRAVVFIRDGGEWRAEG